MSKSLIELAYEFVSSRKTDHGDLPDKALLFNYAIFNSSENFERVKDVWGLVLETKEEKK